ncbi:MAG: MoaD/ThiS family protein [Alphaproteobacteria bacterium]
MQVTLKLFALLSAYLPPGSSNHEAALDLPDDTTPAQVVARLNLPQGLTHLVLVNGVYVPPNERTSLKLRHGDVLAIWPPVAGG